jgi:hypothetical protein
VFEIRDAQTIEDLFPSALLYCSLSVKPETVIPNIGPTLGIVY